MALHFCMHAKNKSIRIVKVTKVTAVKINKVLYTRWRYCQLVKNLISRRFCRPTLQKKNSVQKLNLQLIVSFKKFEIYLLFLIVNNNSYCYFGILLYL